MRPGVLSMLTIILFSAFLMSCNQQETVEITKDSEEMGFDSLAAAKYGADEYGMKKYVIAFLKRGPNRDRDSLEAAQLQLAHMENIGRMAEEGKLALAGPFFGDGDLRGIYIFNVESLEEAEILANSDPAVQAGSLEMDLKEWYGSAALMAVNEIHGTLSRQNVSEDHSH